jgi:hypothetical protein
MAVNYISRAGQGGWGEAGSALGTGLGKGIQALAEKKLNDVLQQKKESQLSKLLQGVNYDESTSNTLAHLAQLNPNHFHDYLEMVGSGGRVQPEAQVVGQLPSLQAGPQEAQAPSLQRQEQEKTPLFANKTKERIALKQAEEVSKLSAAEKKEIRKEVLPFIKNTQDKARGAEENDLRLDRMEALIKSGKLNNPQFASLIKSLGKGIFGFGIDLSSLMTPESQQFDKLSNDFLKSIKDIFGARISNLEVENFLKTVPNLSQTNAGKVAVIENLRDFNNAAKIRRDATKELVRKYGSNLPIDFSDQVEELARPELDRLAMKFKKIADANPAANSPTVGGISKALAAGAGGALLGAGRGSIGGIPGAAIGAGIGGLAGLSGLL